MLYRWLCPRLKRQNPRSKFSVQVYVVLVSASLGLKPNFGNTSEEKWWLWLRGWLNWNLEASIVFVGQSLFYQSTFTISVPRLFLQSIWSRLPNRMSWCWVWFVLESFFFPAGTLEMEWKLGAMRGQPSAVGAHCSLAVHLGSCRKNTSCADTHLDWESYQQSRKSNSFTQGYLA